MHKLSQQNQEELIDLLSERMTFERAAVNLYDAVIDKMQATGEQEITRMLPTMKEHRDQEEEHGQWLKEQIEACGGDASETTERSKLVETQSIGIEKVILNGDPDVSHLFHALLSAELMDNAGWELLVKLAEDADDEDARRQFIKRLHQEEDHLDFLRKAVSRKNTRDVLGAGPQMPTQ